MTPPLLEVDDLVVHYPAGGMLRRREVQAVNGVSLRLEPGETLGLVGESGSGKSTLGRALLGLTPVTAGHVGFDGKRVSGRDRAGLAHLRRNAAMIFQDPFNALNPRQTIATSIAEVLRVKGEVPPAEVPARVAALLDLVGLRPDLAGRKPHALSGGQCQRAGIARALAIEPRLVIADECVAALDVSIQGQIINLLIELKARMGLAMIFIAHDLAIVRRLCDRVAVMYLGRIVEEGPTEAVFSSPRHPYTAALVAAIPSLDPARPLPADPLPGEPPSPLALPPGCAFHPRCRLARPECREMAPPARHDGERITACVLSPDEITTTQPRSMEP
ncbi:ABC transporter ATP-binding protein [Zavarzinia aquatilis]|uniref:Glutathione import ATP-binding protein GsiA n=1 Tax=Zavarzinia aquatilis TaxID=2211142 RepID=A0A317E3S5_9PROT|nr:ABC transporter ATP-binding protein [Zavarzinia aquatilis]PWR21242.1 ABC transporter ATP-binding protein [Zavarzinia aquatilis]